MKIFSCISIIITLCVHTSCSKKEKIVFESSEFFSQCGLSLEYQDVERYTPKPGSPFSKQFVKKHSKATGAIGTISVNNRFKSYCSGTLLVGNYFLTAGHCMVAGVLNDYVVFNYHTGKVPKAYKILSILEHEEVKIGMDYAIMKLDGNPNKDFGYAKLSQGGPKLFEPIIIFQHPRGKPKQVDTGKLASIGFGHNTYSTLRYNYLDTEGGSSGAGIYNVQGELIGVHNKGGCDYRFEHIGGNLGISILSIREISNILK